jgi:small subunit ribosomal protein S2
MTSTTMKDLIDAGLHFGHETRRWNPKMAPYLWGQSNGIHIIDLRQTVRLLDDAISFVRKAAADGGKILFIGTKKQARNSIAQHAESVDMPYVNFRWLGGMLTNFQTIRQRISYMKELEAEENSGEMQSRPKKERLRLRRDLEKLQRSLGGVSDLNELPAGVFVIDVNAEETAVREAVRLGIPIVALVDSNCNPEPITYVIPGNDDAIRSAELLCSLVAAACQEGKEMAKKKKGSSPDSSASRSGSRSS